MKTRAREIGRSQRARGLGFVVLGVLALTTSAAWAGEPCRDWLEEQSEWRAISLRRSLDTAESRSLDAALFELVQREAYLTACPDVGPGDRKRLVGWRLVDRPVEEYGSAVVESVLEESGFDLSLRTLVGPARVARARR